MLDLPKSTEFNKRIPKQKFYEKIDVSPALKRVFVEQIKIIYWRNKLAATTLNLAPGISVDEIEIIEIKLSSQELDVAVLRQIDKEIPYHILFVLECEGKYRAVIGYKEKSISGKSTFKVDRYPFTGWMEESELPVRIEGLTMDAVYENFVRQIAGPDLGQAATAETTLKDSIEIQKQREQLQKQIAILEAKIRNEKQPKKKFELVQELRTLQDKLGSYDSLRRKI